MHHNVEFVYGENGSIKYALKYLFKGATLAYVRSDRVDFNVVDYDEPEQYARCYYTDQHRRRTLKLLQ